MNENFSYVPVRYFNVDFLAPQPIHRTTLKKRIFRLHSLNCTVQSKHKKSLKNLQITVTSYKYPNSSPKKQPLKLIQNQFGSQSLIHSSENNPSPNCKPIIVNSVLKNTPLRLKKRPFSAALNRSTPNDLNPHSKVKSRKNSTKSQITSIENIFEQKPRLQESVLM